MKRIIIGVISFIIIMNCSSLFATQFIGPSFNVYQENQGIKVYDTQTKKTSTESHRYQDFGVGAFYNMSLGDIFSDPNSNFLNSFIVNLTGNINYNEVAKLMIGGVLRYQFETWTDVYPYLGGSINSSTGGTEWVGVGAVLGINFNTSADTIFYFESKYDLKDLYIGKDSEKWDYRKFWTFSTGLGFKI